MSEVIDGVLYLGVPSDSPFGEGDEECPRCGYTFDDEEWEYSHAGDSWRGSASYTCPECRESTVTVQY